MAKESYTVFTTSGGEVVYNHSDLIDIVKKLEMKQHGKDISLTEAENLIPEFIRRYKLVDTDSEGNVLSYEEIKNKNVPVS